MKKGKKISANLEPIKTYYQFNLPEEPNEKYNIVVLKKGQEINGKYVHVFLDKEYNPEKPSQTHVIQTFTEGKVTVKGCTSLNIALEEIGIGGLVSVVYQGKGKAVKKGRKPPYLFDVYPLEAEEGDDVPADSEDAEAPAPKKSLKAKAPVEDSDEDESDDDSNELPF